MNNTERLYLIKASHAPGSIGAFFEPEKEPSIGSKSWRSLPKDKRQEMLEFRDLDNAAAEGITRNMPYFSSLHANNARLPTAKGGLSNIPHRPAAHPLSSPSYAVQDETLKPFSTNTSERRDRGMPVQLHKPYSSK